jgi:hypothetical protein
MLHRPEHCADMCLCLDVDNTGNAAHEVFGKELGGSREALFLPLNSYSLTAASLIALAGVDQYGVNQEFEKLLA